MSTFNMFGGSRSGGSSSADDAMRLSSELQRLREEITQVREEYERAKLIGLATVETAISVYQEMREMQVFGGAERRLSSEVGSRERKEEFRRNLCEMMGGGTRLDLVSGLIESLLVDDDVPDPSQLIDGDAVRRLRSKK